MQNCTNGNMTEKNSDAQVKHKILLKIIIGMEKLGYTGHLISDKYMLRVFYE